MSYPLKSAVAIAIATAAAGLSTAVADQHVGDTYFVPQAGIVGLDNDRNADDAGFVGLAVGRHFSEAVSLELGVSAGDYDYAAGGEPLTLRAYSIDALHIFARDSAVSPYITAGAGFLFTDPGAGDADHHPMAQAGLGLFITLAEKQNGAFKFGIRPEVKARVAMPKRNDPQAKYVDYLAGLGFQFAFGDARPEPTPPAPPPPPPPPPPPAPAPEPPRDSDGDGVIDPRDKCPDTPRGVAVDADGCPLRGTATLQGVTFEFNSAQLTAASRPVLDELAADLKRYPRLKIEVQGHTDSVGADAYNLKLSGERANSVREYLVQQGVPAGQLTSRGFGETQPLEDNKTEEGRALNRRVVMNVVENPGDVDVTQPPPAQTNEITR